MNDRKAGSASRVSQLLPASVRSRLRAVVVDANVYGAVGPDVVGLADLAKDLHAIDIWTWVPEPVAWEWAQHLAQQWRSARAAIRTPAGHLRRAGLVSHLRLEPDYEDEAELVEAFLRRLRVIPHVEVIALTEASAVAGLRDQILLRAPAKTKSTPAVKTGGSDSAWLRDVLAKVDGAADALLFLSSDGDIESAYTQWGHQPPLLRSLADIRVSLFEDLPAAVGEAWMLADYLAGRMPADLQSPPDSDLIDATVGLIGALEPDLGEDGLVDAYLTRLTALAGLHRITRKQPDVASADGADVEDRATVRTFLADAHFLADADAVMTAPNADDELVTRTVRSESGFLVGVDLVFEVNGHEVVAVRAASKAVVFAEKGFADPVEAWEELGEALATVPGLRYQRTGVTGRMRSTARSRSLARGRSSACTGRRRGGGVCPCVWVTRKSR